MLFVSGQGRHLTRKRRDRRASNIIAVAVVLIAAPIPAALAIKDQPFRAFEVRRTYSSDMGVGAPVGVAYRGVSDTLVVVDGSGQAVQTTRAGEAVGAAVTVAGDGVTLTVDGAGNIATADGAAGAAFDAVNGNILRLEGTELVNRGTGERISLGNGNQPYRGMAIDAASGLIYVGSPSGKKVHVFDRSGAEVETIDLAGVELADQQGFAVAPSADPTDDPTVQRLYIADGSGALVEVAIAPEPITALAATTSTASLVGAPINTWQWSPPSPDPSGVVWMPSQNRLLVSDSEVEEQTGAGFHGFNLWYFQPQTSVDTTAGDTTSFNNEPTGVGYDPAGNRLFITNDNSGGRVWVISLGTNGTFDLTDPRYSFPTNNFPLAVDAEDVTFHQGNGRLYIMDGVGREVWEVDPGGNGIFEGAAGDDTIIHFDVQLFGASDPEGIAYSPDSGRLLVVDDPSASVYELETNGTLIHQIDISASGGTRIAGISLGPARDGSGATRMYIVDRKVDNGANPNENDGLMYEMTAPLAPSGNQPPIANAGPDQPFSSGTYPATANLDGTASTDDAPGITYLWAKVSGPAATITNPTQAATTVSLSQTGAYTFSLTVTDVENLTDTDEMIITASGPGGPFNWDGAIATSSDDAEELGTGGMRLANSDLELVEKLGDVQTVGFRFSNVQLPANASIQSATLQFSANGVSTGPVSLTIQTDASNNAAPFVAQTNNISNRPRGNASVLWSPPDWDLNDETGPDQAVNVTSLVQEVVQRSGWTGGNALAFIFTGSGTRVANAIDGGFATQLHVVYSTGGPPPNQPPVANAGSDQQVTMPLPATATLNGSGSSDDSPPLASYAWSQIGGPQTATINSPSTVQTDVGLPAFGAYTFRLTVTDGGGLTDTDDVVIAANDPSAPTTIEVPVAAGADDVEEKPTGRMVLGNGDLDMVLDGTTTMIVGLRFTGINLPAGATITNAYIQFRADETQTALDTNLRIEGHDVANAPAFTTVKFNLSTRDRTETWVAWTPAAWTANVAGDAQKTPDLTGIISELISNGWDPTEAMVFIVSGSGKRTADPFEGGFAPRLVITYTPAP
ncbi:MAG: PKD domain-containing protein [Actinomycetota bacterium]